MNVAARIGDLLREKGLKIAIAESCTGGLIAKRITDVAGASDYFEMGAITYSNKAKAEFLKVPDTLLAARGAVSPEVAQSMADGIRRLAGADIGLSATGIAGPGGGTAEKPVGTVYIGLSGREGAVVRGFLFRGERKSIREETSEEALKLILNYLEEGSE